MAFVDKFSVMDIRVTDPEGFIRIEFITSMAWL